MLARLFEHNNWANQRILEACASLTDEQLDATPDPASPWNIRKALLHLVESQRGYLALLTQPPVERPTEPPTFDALEDVARTSGEALLALARDGLPKRRLRTTDGYDVEPWVVMVQTISHGNDHRRQVFGMLRALGVTPPHIDGWAFGEDLGVLVRSSG